MDTKTANFLLTNLLLQAFRRHVTGYSNEPTIGAYTPHGIPHILGVEDRIQYIIQFHGYAGRHHEAKPLRPFQPLELLLLQLCAWGHDLGMIQSIAEDYWNSQPEEKKRGITKNEFLRKFHDTASAEHICRYLPAIFKTVVAELRGGRRDDSGREKKNARDCGEEYCTLLSRALPATDPKLIEEFIELLRESPSAESRFAAEVTTLAFTTNLIARYHRRAEPIQECPEERTLMGETIRAQLLAAIFRLADALNVDRTRFEKDPFEVLRVLPDFTEENRLHWIKSFIVSSISFDLRQHKIHVQADIPPDTSKSAAALREMLLFIVIDLEEDLSSVATILLQNDFPPLLGVTYEIHDIPAMDYQQDIRAVLDTIYAASSPNTSQQIMITLDRLTVELREAENHPDMELYLSDHLLPDVLKHLEKQLEDRPCHEGLRKIKDLLLCVRKIWSDKTRAGHNHLYIVQERLERRRILWTLIEGVKEVFQQHRKRVEDGSREIDAFPLLLRECDHIVVYGYSHQVILLLSALFRTPLPKLPTVHVLECRTKTKYSHSGRLIYLDGHRYAKALREELPQRVRIALEPDAALGRIIKRSEHGTAVILGSNAVYPDGTFVHSMGHITVASVTKAPGLSKFPVGVIVVTDSMKIGETPKEEERQRNPKVWLTHNNEILDELEKRDITLHNWREDRVPRELIDHLIILDAKGTKVADLRGEMAADGRIQILDQLRFNARQAYSEGLEKRLLASTITHTARGAEINQAISQLAPGKNPQDCIWHIAERFLEGALLAPDAGPDQREALGILEPWLQKVWGENQRKAVDVMRRDIMTTKDPASSSTASKGL